MAAGYTSAEEVSYWRAGRPSARRIDEESSREVVTLRPSAGRTSAASASSHREEDVNPDDKTNSDIGNRCNPLVGDGVLAPRSPHPNSEGGGP